MKEYNALHHWIADQAAIEVSRAVGHNRIDIVLTNYLR